MVPALNSGKERYVVCDVSVSGGGHFLEHLVDTPDRFGGEE